ncbi:MAG: M15 family metallopeptidase [Patescibacteria group bacterium]|nr:M15 family metallopeptidase [Patescibacteria group bacterium]
MKSFFNNIWTIYSVFFLLIILITGIAYYFMKIGNEHFDLIDEQISLIKSNIKIIEDNLTSTTDALQNNIEQTHDDLSKALDNEKKNVGEIEALLGTYKEEVGNISGTVSDLEKLTKTDPELLQKYSKVFFLNEHYSPERLTEIPDNYEYDETRYSKLDSQVWPYLENMLKASQINSQEIYVFSAYRSFDEQNALKSYYSITYGEGTANQFSADQGYSEHQLGTAVDLITTGIGGTLEGFENTNEYQWLLNNAYKFGFVMSYPDNNDYYVFEPWHWRFVGVKLATQLHNDGKNFYDLEQRDIDEYLIYLFD